MLKSGKILCKVQNFSKTKITFGSVDKQAILGNNDKYCLSRGSLNTRKRQHRNKYISLE